MKALVPVHNNTIIVERTLTLENTMWDKDLERVEERKEWFMFVYLYPFQETKREKQDRKSSVKPNQEVG